MGPAQSRINFYTQQIRALNLIWALRKKGCFKIDDRVAVIGAGVAGCACAAGLRAFGCIVDLYDDSHQPFARQVAAQHREIYPDLNFWPETRDLNITTNIPIFDWSVDDCSNVVRRLREQWQTIQKKNEGYLNHIAERVNRITISDRGSKIVSLKVGQTNRASGGYKLAILACGFKPEINEFSKNQNYSAEYWEPDNYEYIRNKLNTEIKDIIISGGGDGGQIDTLRLIFDMRKGRLAFEVAKALDSTSIGSELHELWNKSSSSLLDESTYERLAKKIANEPEYNEVRDLLHLEDFQKSNKRIHIASRSDTPYVKNAAPIHKLMLKYAELDGEVEVHKDSEVKFIKSRNVFKVGSQNYPKNQTLVIVRHGAGHAFEELLKKDELEILVGKQQKSYKRKIMPIWGDDEKFPVPSGFWCKIDQQASFIKEKFHEAHHALTRLGLSGFLLVPRDSSFTLYMHSLDDVPTHLFGIPLSVEQAVLNTGDQRSGLGETFDAA